jgi:hypothetical protein
MAVVNGWLTAPRKAQKNVFYQAVGLNKAPPASAGFGLPTGDFILARIRLTRVWR